jgi:chaperonin GroES
MAKKKAKASKTASSVIKKSSAKASKKPTVKAKSKPQIKAKSKAITKAKAKTKKPSVNAKSVAAMKPSTKAKQATKTPGKTAQIAAQPTKPKAKPSVDLAGLFSPLDDRIVIEELAKPERTAGGLYIPDTAAESDRPREGRVLAVGRGHREKTGRLRPLDVQTGDTVLFEKYSGSGIFILDTEYTVLRESNVLGIVSSRQG